MTAADPVPLSFEGLTLDPAARTLVRSGGENIALRRSEFELLLAFVNAPGRALSRDFLLQAVAGRQLEAFDRSIDVLVGRLRRKIEPDCRQPQLIVTVPGIGYRFAGKPRRTAATASAHTPSIRKASTAGNAPISLPLPDKPSIAVLAFTNMSEDAHQEFFAEGVAEDIITELSRSPYLFVIARNSSFTYKGRAVPVGQIGRELGVRYVLEGSVRKAGDRVRITAQLVEAASGGHLWGNRYDRDVGDVFAVQDEITAGVCAAIVPAIERSEQLRAAREPPASLDAWECYHRGMWHFSTISRAENEIARGFFRNATQLDPRFARAAGMLAGTYCREAQVFKLDFETASRAVEYARRAVGIDPADVTAVTALSLALTTASQYREAMANADIAVGCDPNCEQGYFAQGYSRTYGGRSAGAIMPLRTTIRLNPLRCTNRKDTLARASYWSGDYETAIAMARQVMRETSQLRGCYVTLMAALGQTGRAEEAHAALAEGLDRFKGFREFMSLPPTEIRKLRPQDREHLLDGLGKAGVLE